MQPINQTASGTAQLEKQARNIGNQLQAQDNAQVAQNQSQYQQTYNQSNQAYSNLNNFSNNLPQNTLNDTSKMQAAYGYNPQATSAMESAYLPTLQNASRLNETMASLPQAVQQQSNYSGATAGQVAQNYANQAPGIAQSQAGVDQMLSGLSSGINSQAALGGVVRSAVSNMTSQQQQDLSSAYSSSVSQMQNALQTMNNIENLAQTQGTATAKQISDYQNARSKYIQSHATANQANAQAALNQQKVGFLNNAINSYKSIYGANWQAALAQTAAGQSVTVPKVGPTTSNGGLSVATFPNNGSLQGINIAQPQRNSLSLGNVFNGGSLQGSYGGLQ